MTKILLVEDDKSLREIYGVRLQAEGYEIVSAGDGEEALALAIKEQPSLILSDVMMPKISGFDMLDILRSTTETKDVKVIMMTALSSEDQRARGEALGADRYLVKSQVGIEDVVRTVHEVLGDSIAPAPAAPSFPPAGAPPAAPAPTPESTDTAPTPVAPAPPEDPTSPPVINAPSEPSVAPEPSADAAQPAPAPEPTAQLQPTPEPAPVSEPAPTAEPTPTPIPEPTQGPTDASAAVAAAVPPVPTDTPAAPNTTPSLNPEPQVPTPETPAPVTPEPAPTPDTPPAPQGQSAQTPPTVPLPEPTAPFSTPRPGSSGGSTGGDRVIQPPASSSDLQAAQGQTTDIASQMNQALAGNGTNQTPPQPPQPPTPPTQ